MREYKNWNRFVDPDPDDVIDVTPEVVQRPSWYEINQNAARQSLRRWKRRALLRFAFAIMAIIGAMFLPTVLTPFAFFACVGFLAGSGLALTKAWEARLEIGQPAQL